MLHTFHAVVLHIQVLPPTTTQSNYFLSAPTHIQYAAYVFVTLAA